MHKLPIPDKPSRMGRPPLNVKATMVRLPDGMAEKIDELAGKNRRAEFIREAIEHHIKRRERTAANPKP